MTARGQEKPESRVKGHENNISHNTRGLMNITCYNGLWKTEFMLLFQTSQNKAVFMPTFTCSLFWMIASEWQDYSAFKVFK